MFMCPFSFLFLSIYICDECVLAVFGVVRREFSLCFPSMFHRNAVPPPWIAISSLFRDNRMLCSVPIESLRNNPYIRHILSRWDERP
uniref:Secreted protein n=1 Tax=Ascaris lumbricoides TaxID=6252 RepID=A0A0M3I0B9_ASCLU